MFSLITIRKFIFDNFGMRSKIKKEILKTFQTYKAELLYAHFKFYIRKSKFKK